jgi:hypothetical protein
MLDVVDYQIDLVLAYRILVLAAVAVAVAGILQNLGLQILVAVVDS